MEDELKNRETQPEEETPEPEEVSKIKTRNTELEQVLSEKDAEITGLKKNGAELDERCKKLDEALIEAVTGYKALVIKSNPDIIEDLISGDTIESINESLEKAKALVSRVRQGVEAEISKVKVPAGAPERTSPDLSALSPGEKIRYALGGNE